MGWGVKIPRMWDEALRASCHFLTLVLIVSKQGHISMRENMKENEEY